MTTTNIRIHLIRKDSDVGKVLIYKEGTPFDELKFQIAQKLNIENSKPIRLFTRKGSKLFEIGDTTEIFHDDVLIVSDETEKQQETIKLLLKIVNETETKEQQIEVSKNQTLKEALSNFQLQRYTMITNGKEIQSDTLVNTLQENLPLYLVFKPICLSFLTPSGRIVKVYATAQDTILSVKKQLSVQENFQIKQQKYFYKGIELKDDITVGECNFSEDELIHLKLEYSFC